MAAGVDKLTDRESEVLRLLLGGHTAKSAASELDLSVHTVNDYLREARKKLGVASSREAARILGEQEASAPQNAAPEQFGMAEPVPSPDTPMPSAASSRRNRVGWVIGVTLMFATIITAVLLATSVESDIERKDKVEVSLEQGKPAEMAALDWVKLVDAGDYVRSWAEAGTIFKNAITAEGWAAQAGPVRRPLGKLVGRKLKSIDRRGELPGAPAGDYQIVQFSTDFTAASGTTETVVMSNQDGSWKVVGYFIRP